MIEQIFIQNRVSNSPYVIYLQNLQEGHYSDQFYFRVAERRGIMNITCKKH